MAQAPSGSHWARNKHILQDSAVDRAIEKAKTDLLYRKLLEEKRKEWVQTEIRDKNHAIVNAETKEKRSSNRVSSNIRREEEDDFDSDLELEKELENDPELKKWHSARLEQLKEEFKKEQTQRSVSGHGEYTQMDEKDMLKRACNEESMVIHFFSTQFERCGILDEHLKRIAPKHAETLIVKCDAKKSPFLVNKWKIRTLPSICIIVGGYLVDKIIGFDDFGGKDDFPTIALVRRIAQSGAIKDKDGKINKKPLRTQVLTDL